MNSVTRNGNATLGHLFAKREFDANRGVSGNIEVQEADAQNLDLMKEISLFDINHAERWGVRTVVWAYGADCGVRQATSASRYVLVDALRALYLRGISHVVISVYTSKLVDRRVYEDIEVTHEVYALTREQLSAVRPILVQLQH